MPRSSAPRITWDDSTDKRLLLVILAASDVKPNYAKVAELMATTPNAISKRLAILREKAQENSSSSQRGAAAPQPVMPRTPKNMPAQATAPGGAVLKIEQGDDQPEDIISPPALTPDGSPTLRGPVSASPRTPTQIGKSTKVTAGRVSKPRALRQRKPVNYRVLDEPLMGWPDDDGPDFVNAADTTVGLPPSVDADVSSEDSADLDMYAASEEDMSD
ncbi:MAG: hypothetical protein M1838_000007 [Thelocarpon superellum]|nr:MAG: hypothetical protein M1838_000007 [Thelocarpon superellum]